MLARRLAGVGRRAVQAAGTPGRCLRDRGCHVLGGGGHAGEVEVVEVLQLQVLSLLALLVQKYKY